jgi:hypothetical protein
MAKLTITADFDPDENDPLAAEYGPDGLQELLMNSGMGLINIDVSVGEED